MIMKKTSIFIASTMLLFATSLKAQTEGAIFDYQNAHFNGGQPIGAETNLVITGVISKEVERVEVAVLPAKGKKPLYANVWKREHGNEQESYNLPFNYKLKGDNSYDFVFEYYRPLGTTEKEALRRDLYATTDSYISQIFSTNGKKVRMTGSTQSVMSDLNTIVKDAMYYYRNETEISFPGFSDIVKRGIQTVSKSSLRAAEGMSIIKGDAKAKNKELRIAGYEKRLAEVKQMIHNEIDQVVNTHLLVRTDSRKVDDYPTKHTRNELLLNVGYGASQTSTTLDKNPTISHSPFVGLSFPLGNSAFSGRFLSNSSVSVGVFWNDFKAADGSKLTGPLLGRPYYAAYGYNMFRFLRVNAGAAFLQGTSTDNKLAVRPFVGLSADISFWMNLGKSRK